MEIECDYCGNRFASRKSLTFHQKTSKKCLLERNEKFDSYSCGDCNKSFASPDNLTRHRKTCKTILIKMNVEECINKKDKTIARLKKELLTKDSELKDQYMTRDLEDSRADEMAAELSSTKLELDTIKLAYAKLEMELEKTKEMAEFYKKSASASVHVSKSSPSNRIDGVKKSKDFFCTTANILSTLTTGYAFKNGMIGLMAFIRPMIKDGKNRCYIRTDPTRLHYHRFDGKDWVKDRNCLFIREILDVMKPYVKQTYDDLNNDSKNFTKYDSVEIDKMQKEIDELFPVVMGIIHSDGQERKVLIDDIAFKLKHITDI